ncbi:MAG: hypothetical protein KY464_09855, partial [Gemmatimonadetes bacterium]|nr:hypothetical protein [Gemmatimonadota bacterium]
CLTAFWLVRELGTEEHLLVVCPNSLKHTWQKVIERFFPTWTVSIASGPKRVRLRADATPADVHIGNDEAARTVYAELRHRLRDVVPFAGVEALVEQMRRDEAAGRALLRSEPAGSGCVALEEGL